MFMASPAALGYLKMVELHDYVQFFLVVILFFVLWFYINIIVDFGQFNTRQIPLRSLSQAYTHIKARSIAHLGWLEVVWTIIPIFILTAIAIPSFKLLYALDVVNSPLLTLRCIGNQWYWTYECDIVKPTFLENYDTYTKDQFFIKTQISTSNPATNTDNSTLPISRILPIQLGNTPAPTSGCLDCETSRPKIPQTFWQGNEYDYQGIMQQLLYVSTPKLTKLTLVSEPTFNYHKMDVKVFFAMIPDLVTFKNTIMLPTYRKVFPAAAWHGPAPVVQKTSTLRTLTGYVLEFLTSTENRKLPLLAYPIKTVFVPTRTSFDPVNSEFFTFFAAFFASERKKEKHKQIYALNLETWSAQFVQAQGGHIELLDRDFDQKIINYYLDLTYRFTENAESFATDSYMLDADELQLGAFRLLEVDNFPILPADAEIRLAVTGTDVIHSYAVPSLGVKIDAIPGRLNQFGIRVRSPGVYYGQCSELCGVGHGFMPIKIQFMKLAK
jgi:heme/copper-type cytochrome/quinol oxidase subunit 2